MTTATIPERPPFTLRARLLTPLGAGGYRYEADARIEVDATGRMAAISPWDAAAADAHTVTDLRPWVVLPGMVDLHLHLPQLPNAGLGAGLDLLTWLDRYIFPLERDFDRSARGTTCTYGLSSDGRRGRRPRRSCTARSSSRAWMRRSKPPRRTAFGR